MAKSGNDSLCEMCTGLCCNYITIEIDKPTHNRHYDDIRWYILHEGISLLIEKERWLIQVPTPCTKMTKNGRCAIYQDRPKTCREYKTDNCDYYTVYEDWETEYVLIHTPEELDQFRKDRKKKKGKKKK